MEVSLDQIRASLADRAPIGTVFLLMSCKNRIYANFVHQSQHLLVIGLLGIFVPQSNADLAVSVSLLRLQPYRPYFFLQTRVFGAFRPFHGLARIFVGRLRKSRKSEEFLERHFPFVFLALDELSDDSRFFSRPSFFSFSTKALNFFT